MRVYNGPNLIWSGGPPCRISIARPLDSTGRLLVMGRVPENPRTRPEGFLLTRTRPEPEKNMTNPTRPEPEKLQTRPENPSMQKICIFIKIYIKFSLKKSNQNFFSKNFLFFALIF